MEKERFVREGKDREKLKKSPRSYVKARSPGTLGHAGRLKGKTEKIESEFSGYDEYRYHLANINHNPFILASFLTVKFEDYTRSGVQDTLRTLFAVQYELTTEETVEVRSYEVEHSSTSTWTDENGETHTETDYWTETVYYNYYILDVTLTNHSLEAAVAGAGMTAEEQDRYNLLLTTGGNRSALFADNPYAFSTEGLEYDIPGEALTDQKFANMIHEGEKYLGYPQIRCKARRPDLLSGNLRDQRSQPCGHLRGKRHDAALREPDPVHIL